MAERFISLAETLGLIPPPVAEEPSIDPATLTTPHLFCQAILSSPDFRRYIVDGLTLGTLPSAIITRLMDHGWGKPVDRLEVKDTSLHIEEWTAEQCEQRALFLAEYAKKLRRHEEDEPEPLSPTIN